MELINDLAKIRDKIQNVKSLLFNVNLIWQRGNCLTTAFESLQSGVETAFSLILD